MRSTTNGKSEATEKAMQKLAKTLKLVSANSELYYLKKPSEVTESTLTEVDASFAEIEALLSDFADEWFSSGNQGSNGARFSKSLDDRIDVKLCQNGKLDFAQMKDILFRLNAIDDVMVGLDRISVYIKRYEELCRDKLLTDLAEHAQRFEASILIELRSSIESEGRRLRNQVERCNLYYQPAVKTKTLWVAVLSLVISSLVLLLTILRIIGYI